MKLNYPGINLEVPKPESLLVEGQTLVPDVRTVGQMEPVLKDKPALRNETGTYYMYRAVAKKNHQSLYKNRGIRFDITILPELKLGSEHNKTFGHYHPGAASGIPYPELYEVVAGEAFYLLQKREEKSESLQRVILVKTPAGHKALMPPGFGHVTINPKGLLVMDNLVEGTFKSDYAPYSKNHGAAYYWTQDGLEKNPHYGKVPTLEELPADQVNREVLDGFCDSLDTGNNYQLFEKHADWFEFLKDFVRKP